jgi:hypothetical protein
MMQLFPFEKNNYEIFLMGRVRTVQGQIQINFELRDPQNVLENGLLSHADYSKKNTRAHELWKNTCFEVIWSAPYEKSYFELNINGLGQWNLYHFNDYRDPQPPKESNDFSIEKLEIRDGSLICHLNSNIVQKFFEMNLCAILKTKNETLYYSAHHKSINTTSQILKIKNHNIKSCHHF